MVQEEKDIILPPMRYLIHKGFPLRKKEQREAAYTVFELLQGNQSPAMIQIEEAVLELKPLSDRRKTELKKAEAKVSSLEESLKTCGRRRRSIELQLKEANNVVQVLSNDAFGLDWLMDALRNVHTQRVSV
jgi:chromosome segregation ATPase